MRPVKISVILPAFNEGASISSCLSETARALANVEHEIIVVDDGSTDDTLAQARRAALDDSCVRIVTYHPNKGKGHALKQGFQHATGDLVAFLDADRDLPPRQLLVLWQVMEDASADVVIGSKLHPESRLHYPRLRRFVTLGYYGLVRFLFGLPIHDTQTGIKLFRRQVLAQVFPHLEIEGFAFDLELLVGAHLFGYSIAEAPIVLEFQANDARPLKVFRTGVNMAADTLRVFYWASFWKWLNPGLSIKLWSMALLFGLVVGSISVGHLLNNFAVPGPLERVVDLLLLRFLDRNLRDLILLFAGTSVIAVSAIQLNKHIVSTFTKRGRTDFWEQKGK